MTRKVIYGKNSFDYLARNLALSENGERLILGSENASGNDGLVRVYEWNSSTSTWTQIGADFSSSGNQIGNSVDISDDGNRISIGYKAYGGSNHGRIETYEWNSGTSSWDQMGFALDGTNSGQDFNIVMSGDGNIIALANPIYAGYVEVYEWDSGTTTWTQRGPDIN